MISLFPLALAVVFTTLSTIVIALLAGVFSTWVARKIHGPDGSDIPPFFNIDFDSEDLLRRFMSDVEISDLFRSHPADTQPVRDAYARVRQLCLTLAQELQDMLPECPQKTIAIRQYLVNVMMMSNQAIAVQGLPADEAEAADKVAETAAKSDAV